MEKLEFYKRIKDYVYSLILREIPFLSPIEATIYAAQFTRIVLEKSKGKGFVKEKELEESLKRDIIRYVEDLREIILGKFFIKNWEGKAG
ncbi:MAG: hypothetical protein QXX95_02785 [Nitrososphaerales archaeon]